MVTIEQLRAICLLSNTDVLSRYVEPLNGAMEEFEINSEERKAMFLATVTHESACFSRLQENLNYSAERLNEVWPNRFPTVESARPFSHNPSALAEHVYGGRMGNADEGQGDGYRYRGRGLIQLTGRENYQILGDETGLDLIWHPELLLEPIPAARVAAAFWKIKGCNALADDDQFQTICRRVNGGAVGLADRQILLDRARRVFA